MTAPYDFTVLTREFLARDQRPPDGKLHPSTHLKGRLRHTQLEMAGAPRMENEFGNKMRLITGTLIHEWIHNNLRVKGIPHMPEVALEPWLPEGWKGTADCLAWNAEHRVFALQDYKTKDGKGMGWINQFGAQADHVAQVSTYLWAAEDMGIPLFTDYIEIVYIPITEDSQNPLGTQECNVQVVKPLPKEELHEKMFQIKSDVDAYLRSLAPAPMSKGDPYYVTDLEDYLTDALASPPEREHKIFWDKDKNIWHVRLVPAWDAKYCPYKAPLCTCHDLKTEKIGEYDLNGQYRSRSGYESITPTVKLTATEISRRSK